MNIHFASIFFSFFHKYSNFFKKRNGATTVPTIFSKQQTLFSPGNPAILRFSIHQNNVRTDSTDAVPGNHIIVLSAPKSEKTARTGNNNGYESTFRKLHTSITNKSQPSPVANANNLFTVQF